jgi:hypothetical protein
MSESAKNDLMRLHEASMLGILTLREVRNVFTYLSSLKPSKSKVAKKDEHGSTQTVLECAGPPASVLLSFLLTAYIFASWECRIL